MKDAPFEFSCHRCGHCCSVGSGYVWIEESEIPGLAAALGMSPKSFAVQFVRRVGDRLSLTEKDGRCALLEAPNHCTVYEARPQHCKSFPFWPEIVQGGEALERAREICPGIQVFAPREIRDRAFAALESLYARLEAEIRAVSPICVARGVCCEFEKVDHELFATVLETDYAIWHEAAPAQAAGKPAMPPSAIPGRCRYHVEGLCANREGRPLGCRSYFCDPRFQESMEALYSRCYEEIRKICLETGYPWGYGKFAEMLKGRRERIRREMA